MTWQVEVPMMATIWPGSVAHGNRDPLGQARPAGGLCGQPPRGPPELADGLVELVRDEAGELGVECGQVVARRVLTVLQDSLVAGGAGIADIGAAELPHDPVGGLHPSLARGIRGRVLFEDLQGLGELPFGGDQSAITGNPPLAALVRQPVDAVSLALRGVVAPQLDVGVRAIGEVGQL
jgi:hypothetical protein